MRANETRSKASKAPVRMPLDVVKSYFVWSANAVRPRVMKVVIPAARATASGLLACTQQGR